VVVQDPNPIAQAWNAVSPHITGGSLGIMGTIILCTRWIIRVAKPLVQWASVFRIEHDILWEDFNERTGGPFRRPVTAGRGGYTGREHPVAEVRKEAK